MATQLRIRCTFVQVEMEVEKRPPLLRPYPPSRINSKALDRYALNKLRERARASLDPEDEDFLEGEWGFLYYVMLSELPLRCHRVFRQYFVKKLELPVIARRLGIKVQTARNDLQRALTVMAREMIRVGREGVVAKRK